MNLEQIFSYLGVLGIGSILGVVIKSVVDYRLNEKKMIFDARVKAYSGITGRIFNLFLEPDITRLKDDALIFAKINSILSEACLLGGEKLTNSLGNFKQKVHEFHILLDKKDDEKAKVLHSELVVMTNEIFIEMRKDLFLSHNDIEVKAASGIGLMK